MDGPSHLTRRLAAVVFADVAACTQLVAANEAETLRRWKAPRTEVLESAPSSNVAAWWTQPATRC